ncbi:polysaccharide deacetylase family protein [Sphingomonas sp.]|uniref:polysaccharide deacetylase family protein n=1 Tax=Sphingomonas sp. TaxID=28214 RepID=UPI0035C83FF7
MIAALAKPAVFALLTQPRRMRRRLDLLAERGVTTILNLHRVAPDDGSGYRPLAPELFNELLAFVSRRFHVTTIAALDQPAARDRPRMVLSFDDGYRDFFTHAMPLLARHGLRVNHNLIPAAIERGEAPLNVVAQDFLGRAPAELLQRLDVPGFDRAITRGASGALSRFIKYKPNAERQALAAHLWPQFRAWAAFVPTPMMTLDEARAAAERHEIGAHSFDHDSMECESDDHLRADVQACRAWFRQHMALDPTIYAFPNGSCGPDQIAIVREEGMRHVLLVGERFVEGEAYRFTFDAHGRAEMRFKASGRRAPVPAAVRA